MEIQAKVKLKALWPLAPLTEEDKILREIVDIKLKALARILEMEIENGFTGRPENFIASGPSCNKERFA